MSTPDKSQRDQSKAQVTVRKDQAEANWVDVHRQACRRGEEYYMDPDSGLLVFSAIYLKNRGYCCDSGCRHCPYGRKTQR